MFYTGLTNTSPRFGCIKNRKIIWRKDYFKRYRSSNRRWRDHFHSRSIRKRKDHIAESDSRHHRDRQRQTDLQWKRSHRCPDGKAWIQHRLSGLCAVSELKRLRKYRLRAEKQSGSFHKRRSWRNDTAFESGRTFRQEDRAAFRRVKAACCPCQNHGHETESFSYGRTFKRFGRRDQRVHQRTDQNDRERISSDNDHRHP